MHSGASPTDAYINFYMSGGDDLQFAGYSTDNWNVGDTVINPPAPGLRSAETEILFSAEGEVIVNANNQEDIINTSTELETNTLDARFFQPITNLRDVVRRMYEYETKQLTQIQVNKGFYKWSLDDLLHSSDYRVNPLTLVSSLFFGFQGGLKVKIRVSGLGSIGVRYIPPDIQYIAPGTFEINSTTPSDALVLAEQTKIMEYFSTLMSPPLPLMEVVPASGGVQLAEFVIPFMNVVNFANNTFNALSDRASSTLGDIVLTFPTHVVEDITKVKVTLMLGLTDESRYGFQSYSLIKQPNWMLRTLVPPATHAVAIRRGPYSGDGTGIALSESTLPYYFKT